MVNIPYTNIPKFKGQPFVRVTEATGSWACPYPAWLDKHHPQKYERPKRVHYSGVRGTSVHDQIESYICRTEGIPRRIRDPRRAEDLEVIKVDLQKSFDEQVMKYEIHRCWINFLKFWKKAKIAYEIEVLYCEKKVWSIIHKYAGTCDLICTMRLHGKRWIVFVDWKSGKFWEYKYKWQLSGYRGAAEEMAQRGDIILPKLDFWDRTLCVLLGDISPQEMWSPYDLKGFLNCLRIYKNPQNIPKQTQCVFCGDRYRCKHAKDYNIVLEYIPKGANK